MKLKKIIFSILFSCLLNINNIYSECFFRSCVTCDQDCSSPNDSDNCNNNNYFGKTFFSARPQDSNAARRIVSQINKQIYFFENFCFTFNLALQYQQSFKKKSLGKWFSLADSNCMTIGNTSGTNTFDINAGQIGLNTTNPSGSVGSFCINPKISNFIADFNFQFALDEILCGLWSEIDLTLVRTKTNLGLNVLQDSSSKTNFAAGLYSSCCSTSTPYSSICQALSGDQGFGNVPPLESGKFSPKSLTKTGIAAIHFDLGYDLIKKEKGYLAATFHLVIPTGNRPTGKYLFEPIIGPNKCWQLGTNIRGSYDVLSCCDNKSATLYLDATLTTLLKAKQTRLFSLKSNGIGSQYMLLKRLSPFEQADVSIDRVANVFSGETKIGSDIMFDGALMFQFKTCKYFFNVGYNLWARSKEKRSKTVCFKNYAPQSLGIKGDLPLTSQIEIIPAQTDCFIIGPAQTACGAVLETASKSTISKPAPSDGPDNLIFVQNENINFNSPLHPCAVSHKIFGSIGCYELNFFNRAYDQVSFLIGGEIEFSSNNAALNQWGVLFEASVSI